MSGVCASSILFNHPSYAVCNISSTLVRSQLKKPAPVAPDLIHSSSLAVGASVFHRRAHFPYLHMRAPEMVDFMCGHAVMRRAKKLSHYLRYLVYIIGHEIATRRFFKGIPPFWRIWYELVKNYKILLEDNFLVGSWILDIRAIPWNIESDF